MLEIGSGRKIPKLNFVSHLKISRENCRKTFLWPNIELWVETPKVFGFRGKASYCFEPGKFPAFILSFLFSPLNFLTKKWEWVFFYCTNFNFLCFFRFSDSPLYVWLMGSFQCLLIIQEWLILILRTGKLSWIL